jgi:hypothetical protein
MYNRSYVAFPCSILRFQLGLEERPSDERGSSSRWHVGKIDFVANLARWGRTFQIIP